jgi:phosphoribosyl 1,2-cyclic phosphate phosphodiesterase
MLRQGQIESWANQRTYDVLLQRFGYCFEQVGDFYAPLYGVNVIHGAFAAAGLPVVPIEQDHGTIPSIGLRFGAFGYANDLVAMPEASLEAFKGVDVLVVDAMRYRPHPTHAHLDLALDWVKRIEPKRAFLTNLHVDMDYAELDRVTPAHVQPCHDGLVINI